MLSVVGKNVMVRRARPDVGPILGVELKKNGVSRVVDEVKGRATILRLSASAVETEGQCKQKQNDACRLAQESSSDGGIERWSRP